MIEAKRKPFTFPSSGKTIHIEPISLMGLAMKVQRKFPPPQPPRQKVDYGDGKPSYEFNYAHPDYQAAIVAYNAFVEQKSGEMAQKRIFAGIRLNEEQQAEVTQWKAENPDLWDQDDSDLNIWIEEIAIKDLSDFDALMKFMNGDPDEEEVKTAVNNFQGDVQGA